MHATQEQELFCDLDELVAYEAAFAQHKPNIDPRGRVTPGKLSNTQQLAALRALHNEGADQNIGIDLRDNVPHLFIQESPTAVAPRPNRLARLRERASERLSRSMPPIRRAVGAIALTGLALLGGGAATHGNTGNALQAPKTAVAIAPAHETTPSIDLSNPATANALGRMIVSFDDIRVQMGPTANEAQIQAAQFQALDYAAALEATNA